MKNLLYLLSLTALIVLFNACKKDNNNDAWREANINAFEAISKNPGFSALQTETGPAGIFYKVIKTGTGTEYPFQTSNVKILYKGSYYDGTVFDTGSSTNDIPIEFSLIPPPSFLDTSLLRLSLYTPDNISRGLSFALQNMVVGDKWEIWIPYFLGYGYSGLVLTDSYSYSYQTIVEAYSTLIYEVELVSITLYPQ